MHGKTSPVLTCSVVNVLCCCVFIRHLSFSCASSLFLSFSLFIYVHCSLPELRNTHLKRKRKRKKKNVVSHKYADICVTSVHNRVISFLVLPLKVLSLPPYSDWARRCIPSIHPAFIYSFFMCVVGALSLASHFNVPYNY